MRTPWEINAVARHTLTELVEEYEIFDLDGDSKVQIIREALQPPSIQEVIDQLQDYYGEEVTFENGKFVRYTKVHKDRIVIASRGFKDRVEVEPLPAELVVLLAQLYEKIERQDNEPRPIPPSPIQMPL